MDRARPTTNWPGTSSRFCVAPSGKAQVDIRDLPRRLGGSSTKPTMRNAIGQWRAHWQTNGREIVSGILATMWSRTRQGDHYADDVLARFVCEGEISSRRRLGASPSRPTSSRTSGKEPEKLSAGSRPNAESRS